MKYLRFLGIALLIICLMMVRYFETTLFYDPLLWFFKSDFQNIDFPSFNIAKHLGSMTLRYTINSILSLGIIYLLFQKQDYVKVSALVMLVAYFVFLGLYYYFIKTEFSLGFTAGFYIRRLLIQPVLLLLFIPGFWYFQHIEKNNLTKTPS